LSVFYLLSTSLFLFSTWWQQICQKKPDIWKQTTKYVKRNLIYKNRQQVGQKKRIVCKQANAKETWPMKTDNKYVKRNISYENRQQICRKKPIIWRQTTSMLKETFHMKTDNKYVKRDIPYENRRMQKKHNIWEQRTNMSKETYHMKTDKYVKRNISYEYIPQICRTLSFENRQQVCQKKNIIWKQTYAKDLLTRAHVRRYSRYMYTYERVMSQMNRLFSMPCVWFI